MSLEQYKDANRKELWEILQIQVERIAELEKERDEANCHAYYILDTCTVFSPKKLEVHNLEQQAKGLEDYVSKTMDNSYILHLDPEDIHHCILINLNATALRLLERAKALKEQE
tara:strand:- start:9192 stop:9533 length:342 start_codon:yes stop_codon:yes gene_type:complete